MEENIDVYALVIDQLNKNDMWFTTKTDPTMENARSYYVLDEYGEPTEATIKKIVKEVESLIGDGAIDIYDAIELWINDSLIAFTIDYRNNLVTQFKDKPVVDNIEAYVNPVQFPQSKKQEAKIKKIEYYAMPDDEHIIWDSEVDYYDDDYMENVKRNQYQDYLNDFEPSEPLSYEEWLDSEECYDDHYYMYEQSGLTDWEDIIKEYANYFKEDYDEYIAYYRDEPLPFDKWYDNYIQQASYDDCEYLEDDLKSNIFPEIDKQLNDDVLILSGYYGSNYPDFKSSGAGGKLFERGIKDFNDYRSDFDRVCITSQNGTLGVILNDHDGTVSGQFFTLPDDTKELIKAMGYEDIVRKEHFEDEEGNPSTEEIDDIEDYMEDYFYEDLRYGGIDVSDLTAHIDLLKPIKDTISGYANKSENKNIKTEVKGLKFKVNDIVEDKTGVGKIMEIDPEHPEGLIYGVQFSNVDLPNDKDDIGLWWCKEEDISLVTDKAKIDKYNKWFNTEYNKLESKKAERKKKQIEAFKNRKVNFNKRTKEENYQRRLDEVNNKSKNLISDLFSSSDFDSDSPAGQIVMRTSEMFNALSDKGYDVEVTFDNGESTSAIQLGQQGGKVMITITNTNQPLRAFTSGNFEINDQNIKILQDIQSQIEVL